MQENTASNAAPKSYKSGIQTWSLVIAILIILPGAYAFLYFTDRDNYLTNRYFRALGEVDRQINQGLIGLDGLLGFALDPEISPDRCRDSKICDDYQRYLRQYSQQFAQVKFGNKGKCVKADAASPALADDKTYFEVNGVPDNRKVITYECADQCAKKPCAKQKRLISVSVSISELIDPAPALQYFDQVLLLDAQGDVIYRSGKDDLTTAENIAARDDYARFENLGHYLRNEVIRTVDLSAGWDSLAVDKKTAVREVSHSTIREATIGKVDYLLFIQPFHAAREQVVSGRSAKTPADATSEAEMGGAGRLSYLVGVVPYQQYFLDIVSLPLWKITNLVLLFLFLLALVPHLKLYFSGSYFMPNRVFAWWLGFTFPLLTLFIWDAGFAWDQYFELQNSMDQEAKSIARKLTENYQWEIGKVMREQKTARLTSVTKQKCQGNKKPGNSYPAYEVAFYLDRTGKITGCSENYRTVEMRTETSVDKRNYFSIPIYHPELLYSWAPDPIKQHENNESDENNEKETGVRYYSERIQSYDHGLKLTALSFPMWNDGICTAGNCANMDNKNPGEDRSASGVFVLVKLMHAFFAPVLPFGFGFAVIDDHSGEVYYHANDQRSLLENFYIETDRNIQLIAAVRSRNSQFLSGIYNAQPHRLYTSPLNGTPWSLVVFYDIGSMDLASLRTVLQSLIYAASPTILLFMTLLITRLIFPRKVYRPLRALLPNGALVKRLHACWQRTGIERLTDQSFPVIYVGSAISLVFILFGIVAWLTFSYASKDQIERLQRFNLLHSGQAILKRIDLLELEQQRLGIPPGTSHKVKYIDDNDDKALLEFAVYYPRHFKANAIFNASGSLCKPEKPMKNDDSEARNRLADSDTFIDWFLPIFNRFDAGYLQMRYAAATDKSWYFGGQSSDAFASLCLRNDVSGSYTRISSSHPVPHRHSGPLLYAAPDDVRNSHCPEQADQDQGSLCHSKPINREGWLFLALILGMTVLYQLGRLTSARLMGLYLPEPRIWAEHQMIYRQVAPIEIITVTTENPALLARKNLTAIANGTFLDLQELRAMLYNRADGRIINTYHVTPVMWLILSGILCNENGLEFQDKAMKTWIQQQSWRQESHDLFQSHSSDLWRVLAPSFYVLLLLGFVLITLSGGKIGDFLIGILPIALAGGIPVLANLVRERLK